MSGTPTGAAGGSHGPLSGVRVIDMTSVVVGPYATQLLADYGAEVIKVEAPGGDQGRYITGGGRNRGMAAKFLHLNRNKRSIVVDAKRPDGRELLLRLARGADVLVYNVRPAAMARLGLAYDEVAAVNPRIVYCGLYGFGQRGRYRARPAYDPMLQGITGTVDLQRKALGETRFVPFMVVDRSVALVATYCISMALYEREQSGRGQAIEVPMFENMVNILMAEHLYGGVFEDAPERLGDPRQLDPNFRPLATRDGHVCVSMNTDRQAHAFFDLIGRPELKSDERYRDMAARTRNMASFLELRAAAFRVRTTAEWLAALDAADIPCAPVQSLEEVLRDPHLGDTGFFERVEHPTEGRMWQLGIPNAFSRTPGGVRHQAPTLAADTDAILREAGLSEAEIEALVASGAVERGGGAYG